MLDDDSTPSTSSSLLALLVALAGTAFVWFPLTRVYFYEDDYVHLYHFANGPFLEEILRPHAGHSYLARNLVWRITLHAFGPHAEAFFSTVLLAHLVAVAFAFLVALRVTRRPLLACLAAMLFGACPTDVGAIGWYSVFGHALSTLVVLGTLTLVVRPSGERGPLDVGRLAACAVLLAIGATCFGVGLAMAAVFPAVVWLLAPPAGLTRRAWVVAALVPLATVAVYFGQRALFVLVAGDAGGESATSVIPAPDVGAVVTMLLHFVGYGAAIVLLGPFASSLPWVTAVPLGAAFVFAAVIVAGLVLGSWRERRAVVAFLLLAGACYGAIAVARAPFFGAFGVDTVQVGPIPRYHYSGAAWLALAVCAALAALVRRLPSRFGTTLVAALLAVVLLAHAVRPHPIDLHDRSRLGVRLFVNGVRKAVAAAPKGATVRLKNHAFSAHPMLALNTQAFPGTAALFMIFFPSNDVAGRRVVFEGTRAHVADARRDGGRIASVLVPPPPGQPDPPFRMQRPAAKTPEPPQE